MPLDLSLKITADASQAKSALKDVETGIKNVEAAAAKTNPTIKNVTESFSDYHARVGGDAAAAMRSYVVESSKVEAAALRQQAAVVTLTEGYLSGSVASGGLTTAMGSLTGGLGL